MLKAIETFYFFIYVISLLLGIQVPILFLCLFMPSFFFTLYHFLKCASCTTLLFFANACGWGMDDEKETKNEVPWIDEDCNQAISDEEELEEERDEFERESVRDRYGLAKLLLEEVKNLINAVSICEERWSHLMELGCKKLNLSSAEHSRGLNFIATEGIASDGLISMASLEAEWEQEWEKFLTSLEQRACRLAFLFKKIQLRGSDFFFPRYFSEEQSQFFESYYLSMLDLFKELRAYKRILRDSHHLSKQLPKFSEDRNSVEGIPSFITDFIQQSFEFLYDDITLIESPDYQSILENQKIKDLFERLERSLSRFYIHKDERPADIEWPYLVDAYRTHLLLMGLTSCHKRYSMRIKNNHLKIDVSEGIDILALLEQHIKLLHLMHGNILMNYEADLEKIQGAMEFTLEAAENRTHSKKILLQLLFLDIMADFLTDWGSFLEIILEYEPPSWEANNLEMGRSYVDPPFPIQGSAIEGALPILRREPLHRMPAARQLNPPLPKGTGRPRSIKGLSLFQIRAFINNGLRRSIDRLTSQEEHLILELVSLYNNQ